MELFAASVATPRGAGGPAPQVLPRDWEAEAAAYLHPLRDALSQAEQAVQAAANPDVYY